MKRVEVGSEMGTAKINVWVTERGQPCKITSRDWRVAVAHCNGEILEWCGKKYDNIPAKCGHAEIEVPPGCYVVAASYHFWYVEGVLMGNVVTDHAIVQVSCGETACVTLYTPTANSCVRVVFDILIPLLVQNRIIRKEEADAAIAAMRPIRERLLPSPFDKEEEKRAKELVKRLIEMKPEAEAKKEKE